MHPARKSATVIFIESGTDDISSSTRNHYSQINFGLYVGATRIVETKYLRRDPQDVGNGPSVPSQPRGGQTTRIYTPRNRGATYRGGW